MTPDLIMRRSSLRKQELTRFIHVDEYVDRATSRMVLVRVRDEAAGLQGLHDPDSGCTFYVEDEELRRSHALS